MATHSIFFPEESHGQRSPGGYSHWGHKRVGQFRDYIIMTVYFIVLRNCQFILKKWLRKKESSFILKLLYFKLHIAL